MPITISGHDFASLEAYGLGDGPDLEFAAFVNERESGYGDNEGDWYATVANHEAPDGVRYHVLWTGTHGNDHSPGASHYTTAELYRTLDPAEFAAFQARAAELEAMPEYLEGDTDDESDGAEHYEWA